MEKPAAAPVQGPITLNCYDSVNYKFFIMDKFLVEISTWVNGEDLVFYVHLVIN